MSGTQKGKDIRNYFIQKLEKQDTKRISPTDIQEMNELAKELIQLSQTFGFQGN